MWTGEQAREVDGGSKLPRHCPPCGKRIRFPAEILLIESREGCGPLELTRRRRGRIPLRTTLSQIPLKSFGFPGAESARKRFFLRGGQAPTPKKSAPGGDQPKSSISLGRSRSDLLALWASNLSDAQVAGLDWKSRGFTPSRALPGLFWWRVLFPEKRELFFDDLGFRPRGRGALRSPTPPRVTGVRAGCDPLALSRGCAFEGFVFDDAGCAFDGFCFRRRGRGALRSPTPPRGRGARGLRPSRALPGAVLLRVWFPTMWAILLRDFVSDDAGVGRSAPLHPLG